jgi:hypothetical protein
MKTAVPILAFILLVANSCSKICGCELPPPFHPLNFEIVDKNGNSLVSSLKDTVSITYADNNYTNTNKTIRLALRKLYTSFQDTTTVSLKYNGIYITDYGQMSILSGQNPPVSNFNLSVNGVNEGVIYINFRQYQATFPQLSASAFTFNSMPAIYTDNLSLLQLQ